MLSLEYFDFRFHRSQRKTNRGNHLDAGALQGGSRALDVSRIYTHLPIPFIAHYQGHGFNFCGSGGGREQSYIQHPFDFFSSDAHSSYPPARNLISLASSLAGISFFDPAGISILDFQLSFSVSQTTILCSCEPHSGRLWSTPMFQQFDDTQ